MFFCFFLLSALITQHIPHTYLTNLIADDICFDFAACFIIRGTGPIPCCVRLALVFHSDM